MNPTTLQNFLIGAQAIFDPKIDLIPGIGPNERMRASAEEVKRINSDPNSVFGTGEPAYSGDVLGDSTSNSTGGSVSTAPQYSAADEQAFYNDQISQYDSLLKLLGTQRDTGLNQLNNYFGSQSANLANRKTKTMAGYDQQSTENSQNRQRGVEQVDSFANNSYNSLQRLLGAGNAGKSSVARELVPYLVSKSAGTRRTGVFDTAGRNDQAIASARGDAEDEFRFSEEDLGNQRKGQEQSLRQNILNEENRILAERRNAEIARAQATGQGYTQARNAAAATAAGISERQAQLGNLFSQFAPSYNARQMNLRTPELGRFTVDPAQIRSEGQGTPSEASYYLNQIRRRDEDRR